MITTDTVPVAESVKGLFRASVEPGHSPSLRTVLENQLRNEIPNTHQRTKETGGLKRISRARYGPEKAYDDITRLAAHICQVPITMVSLVDETRQWFKSKVGLKKRETPREVAFCSHAILRSEPLIVRDALRDRRFAENALVTGAPRIRFYAGFPLLNPEGFVLGTLCAVDGKPHRLSAEQRRAMQALARQVMALLELRRVSTHLADALEHVKTLHGLLPICAWCKRIRDDQGYWSQLEAYIHAHSEADFTHGICPDCLEKHRPHKTGRKK